MAGRREVPKLSSDSSEVQLLIDLLKLSSIISRPMQNEVAAHHDLTINELRVVTCLGGEGALAGQDISHIMSMSPMNVSRALAALDARGWTEPVSSEGNRRRRPVQLSSKGWKAYGSMLPDVRAVASQLFEPLGKSERQALSRSFDKLLHQIEAWETTDPMAAPKRKSAD